MNKKHMQFLVLIGIFWLALSSICLAQNNRDTAEWITHDYLHSIDNDTFTQNEIITKFGQPTNIRRRLAGWEIYEYDAVVFKGKKFYQGQGQFTYFPFKNGKYVPASRYERLKRDSNLRRIFFPIVSISYWSGSLFFILILLILGLFAIIFLKKGYKIFGAYCFVGSILVLSGIIF